jgi:hypothetical protein
MKVKDIAFIPGPVLVSTTVKEDGTVEQKFAGAAEARTALIKYLNEGYEILSAKPLKQSDKPFVLYTMVLKIKE